MTTEVRNYYHPAAYSQDLGVITAKPFERPDGSTCAIIDLASDLDHPRAGSLWIDDPAIARELLAAAFEALMILDPDGAVIVRTGNREIHTVAEILPGREPAECELDECDCHDAPAPDAVKQVRELLPKTTLHEPDPGPPPFAPDPPQPAPFTAPGLVTPPADEACPQTAEGCTDESCTEHAPRTAVLSCGHNHSVPDDAQPGDLVFCVHCAVRRAMRAESQDVAR